MTMQSMKLSAAERKEEMAEMSYKPPEYPYGLQISLDEDQISALGLGTLAVGAVVMISAKAKITSCSSYDNENGKEQTCSLQITDMEINAEGETQAGKSANKLYPSS